VVIRKRVSKGQSPTKRTAKKRSLKKQNPKKQAPDLLPKLSETEQDLLWHMKHGYRLETDSLGADPVLRNSKDDEVIRPASANRNTVNALQKRGLITPAKSRNPLKIVWQTKDPGSDR
jgi:hypothetical protein